MQVRWLGVQAVNAGEQRNEVSKRRCRRPNGEGLEATGPRSEARDGKGKERGGLQAGRRGFNIGPVASAAVSMIGGVADIIVGAEEQGGVEGRWWRWSGECGWRRWWWIRVSVLTRGGIDTLPLRWRDMRAQPADVGIKVEMQLLPPVERLLGERHTAALGLVGLKKDEEGFPNSLGERWKARQDSSLGARKVLDAEACKWTPLYHMIDTMSVRKPFQRAQVNADLSKEDLVGPGCAFVDTRAVARKAIANQAINIVIGNRW